MITAGLILLLGCLPKRLNPSRARTMINVPLATLLLGNEVGAFVTMVVSHQWTFAQGLPLNLCSLAIFATSYALLTQRQFVYEIAYFWALGGTLQAVLTPDIRETFPHYQFLRFFISHCGVLIGVMYLTVGLRFRPTPGSVWRMVILTNAYAVFVGLFNWIFRTNYLYLCEKPRGATLMDAFGPWPFYIVGLEVAGILSFLLYYSPFFFLNKRRNNA